jgi:NADH:ubiquinone oxidoreductase subunit 5 (subunit L)/multisubunit Na+/H+ antiporter MnhA subunit
MAVAMLSLAGLPPFPGFTAKFLIFKSVIAAGYSSYAVLGLVGSFLGLYFYLRVVQRMFMRPRGGRGAAARSGDGRQPAVPAAGGGGGGGAGVGAGSAVAAGAAHCAARCLLLTQIKDAGSWGVSLLPWSGSVLIVDSAPPGWPG